MKAMKNRGDRGARVCFRQAERAHRTPLSIILSPFRRPPPPMTRGTAGAGGAAPARRAPLPPSAPVRAPGPPDPTAPLGPQLAALAGDPYYGGLVGGAAAALATVAAVEAATRSPPPATVLPADGAGAPRAAAAVVYVNPRQYHRIMVRRTQRAKQAAARGGVVRGAYLHASRHAVAVKRARGPGGRFAKEATPTGTTTDSGSEQEQTGE